MVTIIVTTIAVLLSLPPDSSRSYTQHAQRLHEHLLGEDSGYIKSIPPTSRRVPNNYSLAGTDVELQLNFFKVDEVSAAQGHMRLKAWIRTTWTDQRLSWDPNDFGNITFLPIQAYSYSMPEDTEIWLPDIKLYNSADSIITTFDPAPAMVYSTGYVFWSRPGTLDILCKFTGLVAFPFDNLTCAMEFGGWGFSGRYQGITLAPGNGGATGDGWALATDEMTTGASYQEYTIDSVHALENTLYYPCCPTEPWPLAVYFVALDRAAFFYYNAIIIPGVSFAMLSFLAFFMAHQVGERLGFCVTLILATEVSKVVIASMVPVCGELLWIELFNQLNFLFAVLSLLLSIVSLWFAFKTDESLFPKWLTELVCGHTQGMLRQGLRQGVRRAVQCCPACFARCGCKEPPLEQESLLTTSVTTSLKMPKGAWDDPSCAESCAGMLYREMAAAVLIKDGIEQAATAAPKGERRNTLRVPLSLSAAVAASAASAPSAPSAPPPSAGAPPARRTSLVKVEEDAVSGAAVEEEHSLDSLDLCSGADDDDDAAPPPKADGPSQDAAHKDAAHKDAAHKDAAHKDAAHKDAASPSRHPKRVGFASKPPHPKPPHPKPLPGKPATAEACTTSTDDPAAVTASPAKFERGRDGKIRAHAEITDEDSERLVFFERMFFLLDSQARGFVSVEEAKHFLSFTALKLDPTERNEAVDRADCSHDRRLVRYEFVEMCADLLWDTPLPQLQLAVENFKDATLMFETRNLAMWRAASLRVDRSARFYLPITYLVLLVILWNLDLRDDYHKSIADTAGAQAGRMFEGIGHASMSAAGVMKSLVVPILCLLTVAAMCAAREFARRQRLIEEELDASQQQQRSNPFSGVSPKLLKRKTFGAFSVKSARGSHHVQPFTTPASGAAGLTVQEQQRLQSLFPLEHSDRHRSCSGMSAFELSTGRKTSRSEAWGRV